MVALAHKNPLVLSACICALALYVPLLWGKSFVRTERFCSLLPLSDIQVVQGVVASNPVKTTGGFYKACFMPKAAYASTGAKAAASGSLIVLFPASLSEALYPGKTYTSAQVSRGKAAGTSDVLQETRPPLIESGAELSLTGRFLLSRSSPVSAPATCLPAQRPNEQAAFLVTQAYSVGWAPTLTGLFYRVRALSRLYFKRLMYSWHEAGGFVLALLSGSREYVDERLLLAFTCAGLTHVLALSGMHLTLFAGFTHALGKHLFSARFTALIEFLAVVLFVWFAGLSPSLLRSLLCLMLLLCCSFLRIKSPSLLTVLCTVFLLHVCIAPSQVYESAFLLSYTALLGIALLSPLIQRYAVRAFIPCAAAFSDASGAFCATTPISALLFSRLAPVGIVASVAIAPVVGFFMSLALTGVVCSLIFPFLNPVVCAIMSAVYALIKALVLFFAHFPAVTFR